MKTATDTAYGRRAQQTRQLLQQAAMELVSTKAYETITVQDICAQAGVGRTTFYLYFKSKDELYLSAHIENVARLGWTITLEGLLATEPPDYLVRFIESVARDRHLYLDVSRSEDAQVFIRHMRQHVAQGIEACLRANFEEGTSKVPFTILANYLAGAQVSLIGWWLENRSYPAEQIAATYQLVQRAAIREALALPDQKIGLGR